MFDKLLFLFLILSPIVYSGGQDSFQYASRFLMMGTLALACLSLIYCKPKRFILPKWPLILLLFFVAKLYYLPYSTLTINGVFHSMFVIGLFYLVVNYAQDVKWLYRAVGSVIILNLAYATCQFIGYDPIFIYNGIPAGFFSMNSDLAGYLILTTPLMAHYARGFGFLVPFLFALPLFSFTAIICNFISGVFLTARKGFYPMLAIIVIALSVASFIKISKPYDIGHKLTYRSEIWGTVVKGALQRPLAGYGLGRAVDITTKTGQGSFTGKSDIFEFALEVGFIPAIIILGFIINTLFRRYIRAEKSWDLTLLSLSFLAFTISLLVQSHLRNPRISPTVMVILAWFYIKTERSIKCQS